ncbi:DUF998 domain-containing protein [Actinospica sp.]|jgi:hypothetical protein|uniref:DUF998 domain-containing protein n=1 Tax=Actinospica sp. TaxID=1872142 RepID=UPI002B881A5A|nr:DUF998 domain-containing protein [Actinospica sp.]HWG26926.1 DUF998 domain-containing protein [Actinospica sp.]
MELAVSYLFLRRAIGLIGSLLPIVLPLGYSISTGKWQLLESVSSYYYTDMRNVFVGSLCSIGVFLICYRYEHWDDVITTLAGAFATAVAFFPTLPPNASSLARVVGVLHDVFAVCFFVAMALMSLLLFTRSNVPPTQRTPAKNTRNLVYRICGWLILLFTVLAVLTAFSPRSFTDAVHPLFWCEAIATFAFGFAWWVKGQTLWRDM